MDDWDALVSEFVLEEGFTVYERDNRRATASANMVARLGRAMERCADALEQISMNTQGR